MATDYDSPTPKTETVVIHPGSVYQRGPRSNVPVYRGRYGRRAR